MAGADKSILQLPAASSLSVNDKGVIVQGTTTEQFDYQLLVNLLSASISLGSLITFGTAIPTGGKDTDVYVRTSSNEFYQKIGGTWTVFYTFPAAVSGTSFRYGAGVPSNSLGLDGDSYIDTLTGIFYERSAGAYSQVFSMSTGLPAGPRGFSVLNGTGSPGGGIGIDGDFYLDTATYTMYGPKASGAWGSGTLLRIIPSTILNGNGSPSNGLGNNGDFYLDTSAYVFYGPKASGAWPAGVSLIVQPALLPITLLNVSTNQIQPFALGSFIPYILVKKVSGSPSLDIGTTSGGGELLPSSPITGFTPINAQQYFDANGNLYFNISGTGVVNIYIYYLSNIV